MKDTKNNIAIGPLALAKSSIMESQISPVRTMKIVIKPLKKLLKFILGDNPFTKSTSPSSSNFI